ncbi:acyl-CoA dehydrogenase [Nostoc sp. 3335mG]|nr:acyl-CoA dehydrogenase [Nostoc sp. 3335mG]
MNFEPSEDQAMIAETFARFLDAHSSMARVRAALPSGFDADLWRGIAELGGLGVRVSEADGGMGLGLLDAVLLMEEAGRTLASAPLAEAIVAARILAAAGEGELLGSLIGGASVVTIALHDAADRPVQWVPGGAVADRVIVRDGGAVYLVEPTAQEKAPVANLGSTGIAKVRLDGGAKRTALGGGAAEAYAQGLEEWKLLTAAALAGLSREAIRLASAYATERVQFGQPIGTYQGISHPLAELYANVSGGKLLVWKTIRNIADGAESAGGEIPLSLWWNATVAGKVVAQALQTFGGYGLTTEYDIHLYNLRAKALPLILGDPALLLVEAGRRLYAGEPVALPETGEVSIDFDLGDDARALAQEVRDFFEKTLTPELRAKAHYSFDGHDPYVHRKLGEAKLLFPAWPVEHGGRAASPYATNAAMGAWEEYGWTTYPTGTTQMVGSIIRKFGSDELKAEVLPRIENGEALCSLGFSEPGSGSDVFSAKTRATPDGNGWRIDGSKMFTSGANIADYVLMLTRTNSEVAKHKGLTMFIVPLKAEGVEIQPVFTFQQERTNITYYDGVKIPDSWRLGDVDAGVKVMSASLEMEHAGQSWWRDQQHMLKEAVSFCRETKRQDRAMIEDDAVKARLARVHAGTAVTQVIAHHALWSSVAKQPPAAQGSVSKLVSSQRFLEDAADLLELTAPESLETDGPAAFINLSYRHAHGTRIYGGTTEVHRSQIAERALGLPRTRA